MARPTFNRELAAQAIAECVLLGIEATCDKHRITRRTLERWKKRLDSDTELSQRVATKIELVEKDWADELPGAIRSAIGFLKRAAEQADVKNSDVIYSVAGSLKILSDVTMSRRVLDARLKSKEPKVAGSPRADSPAGEEAGQGAPSPEDRLGLQ
jgi:hypothetical protein